MSVWSVVEPLTLDFVIEVPTESVNPRKRSNSSKSHSVSPVTRADLEAKVKQLISVEKQDINPVAKQLGVSPRTVRRVCRTLKIGNYSVCKGGVVSRSSQSPFGWDVVQGQLQHNPQEWGWVLKIQKLRTSGTSLHKIADALTSQGVPTKNGGRWFAKSISQILEFNRPHLLKSKSKSKKGGPHGTR